MGTHPLLAVGLCLYAWDGKDPEKGLFLVDTCEVHIEGDLADYEEDTLQWWGQHPDAWEAIQKDTVDMKTAAGTLIEFIRKYQTQAAERKRPFKIVTDNCWFDDTWVSWLLCVHGKEYGGLPLRYNYLHGYTGACDMIDITQRTHAIKADASINMPAFTPSVQHDHTPVADARGIAEKYAHYAHHLTAVRKVCVEHIRTLNETVSILRSVEKSLDGLKSGNSAERAELDKQRSIAQARLRCLSP